MRRFQGYAQELQAEINDELTETLNSHEAHDWYRYGKVRDAYEKYIRDPDDVFINAEERRRQLARQGKKPPRRHSAVSTQPSAKSGGRKGKR